MDKKTLGYAISGTPLFCMVIGAIGHENMLSSVKRYAEVERDLFAREVSDEEKDTFATYFIPRTDEQSELVSSAIASFAAEYGETEQQQEFFNDVLLAMYYRHYDLLIAQMDKMMEGTEVAVEGATDDKE